MFDISFGEMFVIAVVALVVIGPKQLPTVARQAGAWAGKMRRYVDDVKSDFNRQAELDELRKIKDDLTSAGNSISETLQSTANETQAELDTLNQSMLTEPGQSSEPTDWDKIWATRRTRDRLKDRRKERSKELGLNRSKFRR